MKVVLLSFALVAISTPLIFALPTSRPTCCISTAVASVPATSSSTALTQEHIVLLANTGTDPSEIMGRVGLDRSHSDVKYTFNNSIFQGFVANLPTAHATALNAMSEVSTLEQSVSVRSHQAPAPGSSQAASTRSPAFTRSNSPWGLQRVSSTSVVKGDPQSMSFTFSFPPNSPLGAGVDIYVLDSGINTENEAFGNRAHMGFSYDANDITDGDGHGTHVAGTAASIPFGIAASANIVGVKVLDANGTGSSSAILAGLDYVISQHDQRKSDSGFVGSIVSMSLGLGSSSPVLNNAVSGAAKAGIHVVVAAGNDGSDACNSSPGGLGGSRSTIVTVGSVGQTSAVSKFSNTGPCVDLYAPGENIISAWKGGPKMMHTLDGTSMATPHVTGVMSQMMSQDPRLGQDPAGLKGALLSAALTGQIRGGSGLLLLNDGVRDGTGTLGLLGGRSTMQGGRKTSDKWTENDDVSGDHWRRDNSEASPLVGSGWTMSDDEVTTRW